MGRLSASAEHFSRRLADCLPEVFDQIGRLAVGALLRVHRASRDDLCSVLQLCLRLRAPAQVGLDLVKCAYAESLLQLALRLLLEGHLLLNLVEGREGLALFLQVQVEEGLRREPLGLPRRRAQARSSTAWACSPLAQQGRLQQAAVLAILVPIQARIWERLGLGPLLACAETSAPRRLLPFDVLDARRGTALSLVHREHDTSSGRFPRGPPPTRSASLAPTL